MRSIYKFVGKDNAVRFIDAFLEHLELDYALGRDFTNQKIIFETSGHLLRHKFSLNNQVLNFVYLPSHSR